MKIKDLPQSTDREYWEHATTELIELRDAKTCEHNFVHKTALEVECTLCHMGFLLSNNWKVMDNHVYFENKFVI